MYESYGKEIKITNYEYLVVYINLTTAIMGAAPYTVLKYLEHCSRTVCNGMQTVLEQCLVY